MTDQFTDDFILYLVEKHEFRVIFFFPILVKLTQGKYRRLEEQFGDNAADAEDIHSPGDSSTIVLVTSS